MELALGWNKHTVMLQKNKTKKSGLFYLSLQFPGRAWAAYKLRAGVILIHSGSFRI